jgi:hypothetical protein
MKALDRLKELNLAKQVKDHPNYPVAYMIPYKPKPNSTNGLTRCVDDLINLSGYFCERTGNEGRVIDSRNTYTDVVGFKKTIGSITRIKGQGTNGTSDLKAVIKGQMIAIEIKFGKDRQSEAQKDYQEKIEKSGGIYLIVKDLDVFYDWMLDFTK